MPTISVQPTSTLDTGHWTAETFASGAGFFGDVGSPINSYLCFRNVEIPQGAWIVSAYMTLVAVTTRTNNTVNVKIRAENADSGSRPTSIEEAEALALTENYGQWDAVSEFTLGETYNSGGFASVIQQIVYRAGWVSGNDITVCILNNGSTVNAYRSIRTYTTPVNYAPTLIVTYNEAILDDYVSVSEEIEIGERRRFPDISDSVSISDAAAIDKSFPFEESVSVSEEIVVDKSICIDDTIYASDAVVPHLGSWLEVRNHPHTTKLYMAIKTPRTLWTGRVVNDRGSNQSGDLESDLLINVTGGAAATPYGIVNFLPDLTLWVGSTAGGKDHGKCRARSFSGDNLVVSADMTCVWKEGDYLTITDLYEYWPRPHKVVADGSSVTVYKDTDIPAEDREIAPVPIMGPPVCAFLDNGSVSVSFHGGQSYLVQPNSDETYWETANGISDYAWLAEGSEEGFFFGPDVTATYTTPGQYFVLLGVVGENGVISYGYRNVFIFERTGANAPIEHFDIKDFSGSLSNHGWECQVEIFGDLFDPDSLPQGAQIVIFSEEQYAGESPTYKLGNPSLHDRENIKMVGWIADTSLVYEANRIRGASVTIQGLQKLLDSRGNFPCYWTQVEQYAPAWSKFWPGSPEYGLTTRKVWYHTIRWHWTLFNFTDVFIPDDHNNYLPGQNFPEGTLASWLTTFCKDTQSDWVVDKGGALHIFSIGNYLPIPGYAPPTADGGHDGAEWRQRLYTDIALTADDFERLEVQARVRHEVARVRVEGVMASDTGWYATSIDMAPGDIRGLNGTTEVKSNQVLGTGGYYGSQGYELALMLYAEESRNVERIRMDLAGNYSFLDIAPYANWFTLTVSPSGGLREIDWTNKPFWVDEMTIEFDAKTGDMAVSIAAKPETWPDLELGVYSQFGEVGTVRQVQASSGSSSFGALLQSIDAPDKITVPALMGNGGGLVEGYQDGTSWVRINGDANYTMLVENRTYANVDNRPILLELVKTAVGTQIARIIATRESDDDDADADSSRARTVRYAVYMNAGMVGPSINEGTEEAPSYSISPFFIVGAHMSKVVLKNVISRCDFADEGESNAITFSVYDTGTLLTSVSMGGNTAATDTTEISGTLTPGDYLGLVVSAAEGASNLIVEVECLVYGI